MSVFSALQRGKVGLEHAARRIFRSRVLKTFMLAQLRLHVRGRRKNRVCHRAGDRLRLLAGVDAFGGKTHFVLRSSFFVLRDHHFEQRRTDNEERVTISTS